MRRALLTSAALGVPLWLALAAPDAPKPADTPAGPHTPKEELATFRVPKGFHVELAASEPDVVDPVAMCFDEDGRLFVAEMRGYPNGGVGTGDVTSGRIVMLEDADGDGVYKKSTVHADGLRFPTGLTPWRGGLLVANSPDLIYIESPDADGKPGKRRPLYTGFNLANIQQLLNGLQWGLDNWVHAVAGNDGGTIRSAEGKGGETPPLPPAVVLRSRGVRFHPETPGSLEPTSGGGQYGLAADDWGRWFVATNSQHLRHIVLPDHYLRRNPALPVGAVTLDIPDHGAACEVHRISPFEPWRVERTTRRKDGPDAARFPSTELVPGGFITSACSPVVYTADAFPEAYRGDTFVCDPANNLVHRDVLVPNGATFTAKRGDADCEFLASTDTWFRPVFLTVGPDGELYVLDFYREVIETPLSLPDDIKAKLHLESRGRGRIWRVAADGGTDKKERKKPNLSKATAKELASQLADANAWQRLTAQRLLVERQDADAVKPLEELFRTTKSAPGRAHALWTLRGLKALDDVLIEAALKDPESGVREQALRLCDERLAASAKLRAAAAALADDPSPRVRFQLAFTLGESDAPECVAALAKVTRRDADDPWTQTAVLSSVGASALPLLTALAEDRAFTKDAPPTRLQLLTRLGGLVGARAGDDDLARAFGLLGKEGQAPETWQAAVLDGLAQGMQNGPRPLAGLWERPPPALKDAVARARALFDSAADAARDEKRPPAERAAAVRLLGRGPFALIETAAPDLLAPQSPPELQLAAVRALTTQESPKVADLLLAGWAAYGPTVRREAAEALFARADRLPPLVTALEQKKVLANQLDLFRVEQLRKLPDARLRERALAVLAGQAAPERGKAVEAYRDALDLQADAGRGKALFKKNCVTCHRLENEGNEVGPDLASALRNKSKEQLLIDLLDPSREVDPRYLNYVVETRQGRSFSGLIAAETASSVTLRRGEKAEDVILRSDIDVIKATGKSVMPEGLEAQLTRQDVADLIAYLQSAAAPK
jgi:putative membrane-bound dehydrogenase-like protein